MWTKPHAQCVNSLSMANEREQSHALNPIYRFGSVIHTICLVLSTAISLNAHINYNLDNLFQCI